MGNRCETRRAEGESGARELESVLTRAELEPDTELLALNPKDAVETHHVYLATMDDECVGCVMATKDNDPIIHSLVVVKERRGGALAHDLLVQAIPQLIDYVRPDWLWTAVDPARTGARERFARLGFVPDENEVQGHALMRKRVAIA